MSRFAVLVVLSICCTAIAQESPAPSPTSSPVESASPSPTPSPTPPTRAVQIRFVPPPMEGTISLGIFDEHGKLVRILHRETKIDNFITEADSLSTTWDGKNDAGEDVPPGKYHARGYSVGDLKIQQVGRTEGTVFIDTPDSVRVKLVANPLTNTRPVIDLRAGVERRNAYLKTAGGLPLHTITLTEDPMATAALDHATNNSLTFFVRQGNTTLEFRVSNIDQMMEFDCGTFDLK